MKYFEYLVIGGGIAGCSLALELIEKGKTVFVIDYPKNGSASRVAAGLFNPIVPRGLRKTWMYEKLIKSIPTFYNKYEKKFSKQLYFPIPITEFVDNPNRLKEWKLVENNSEYLGLIQKIDDAELNIFSNYLAAYKINNAGRIDIPLFCELTINELKDNQQFAEYHCNFNGNWLEKIASDLQIGFEKVILCTGAFASNDGPFSHLYFQPTAGEIIKVECDLPINTIYKKKEWMVPIAAGEFLCGSNYIPVDLQNLTIDFTGNTIDNLKKWIPAPIKVIEKKIGIRPSVNKRKPYLGKHASIKNMYIFNGLGSKGGSLVSYLAPMMAEFLCNDVELMDEINIEKILNV